MNDGAAAGGDPSAETVLKVKTEPGEPISLQAMSAQHAKEVVVIDPVGPEQSTTGKKLPWDMLRFMMLLSNQISTGNKGRQHGYSRDEVLLEYGWGTIFLT